MNINTQSGFNVQAMSGAGRPPPPPPPVQGELSGYAVETSGSDQMTDFMQDFMKSSFSGEFDAKTLSENAPDSLKAYAQNNGVSLEDMLTQAHEKLQSHDRGSANDGNAMPPPSSMQGNTSMASSYMANSQMSSSLSLQNNLMNSISIRVTA
jgi:hypothetical protein